MSTLILENSRASTLSTPSWIISKRQDLFWFVGSALAGYLSLGILSVANRYAFVLSVFWWSVINNPHIFGTASRTYFDSEQRKNLAPYLWAIVPLFLIPVGLTYIGLGVPLAVFAMAWGSWHVAKQHFGFVMIYKRKNGERNDIGLDKWFLLSSQMIPFALFILWYLNAPGRLYALAFLVALQAGLLVMFLWRQIVKYRSGEEMNWPKLMLMALVVPLHWFAFAMSSQNLLNSIFIFSIATNFGHALQYHRLTWFHNRNRYKGRPDAAGVLSKSVVYYYGLGFGLYLLFVMIGERLPQGGAELILMGPTFTHYILDTKIWRVRGDKELAEALRLA